MFAWSLVWEIFLKVVLSSGSEVRDVQSYPQEIIGSGINDKHSLPLALDVGVFVLLFPSPQTCRPGNCEKNRTTVYLATMFLPKLLHDVSSRPFLPEKTTGSMMPSAGSHSLYCTFPHQASTASSSGSWSRPVPVL